MAERVYCLYRVSTNKQVDHDENNQADIPMQRKACHDFAAKMGWVIVGEEQETGVSGYKVSADDRDKLQLIKKYAEQGKFDKFIAVSRSLSGILDYVTNREKTVERLISGVNCMAQTAQDEFEAVKKQFRKTDGRSYYHIVQAFAPDDPLDFDTAHEIGLKFAEYFKGYQCVVVTHMNTAHIHNHIIMNSVNFENGQKFHQSAREMQQAKEYSNQLCREYGLSFTESKADPFRIPAWKKRLCRTIKEAMENCATREEFIAFMAEYGYKVRWEANQKYITYTTPENVRCRDNKLFDQTLLRSSMEAYFDMGGCEYLESRIDATEYGELLPTVDDAVCGLISILDAINTGDNDRFHLETLHHSKQEIRRILERGGKIDRTVEYAVDDEDEEYEQYHGFSMRM